MPTWLRRTDSNRPVKCSIFTTRRPVSPMTIYVKSLTKIKSHRLPKSDYYRTRVSFNVLYLKKKSNINSIFTGEKSSSGHLEFNTLQEAVEALVICNHIPLSGASKKFVINYHLHIFIKIHLSIYRCQMAVHNKVVFLNTAAWSE